MILQEITKSLFPEFFSNATNYINLLQNVLHLIKTTLNEVNSLWWIVGVMIFSVPIIAIITNHMQERATIKGKFIQDQLELEKLKHENYLLETEKLKLELEQMQLEHPKEDDYKLK